ncbi:MAG: hypothetical protein HY756_08005 [Nitrospirae bacterium]|nr:hypothetical protein [Nitrospirota bacterium]
MSHNNYIFSLGGYDVEMVEIKNILESKGLRFYDKNLSWSNASLSAYKDEIGKIPSDAIPIFIELKLDCPYPERSIIIDHHDEKAGKRQKTSIEQVAELLKIELNRKQQLISANDRGHIRAMKKMCATDVEIAEIRALDRKAQGVTDQDEKFAEESIKKCLEEVADNAVIVNSSTNKTSAVFDRLYDKYKHIFIFTLDGEMNYSGTGEVVNRLADEYKKKQEKDTSIEFWFGGNLPDYGFFGTKTHLGKEEIKEMVKINDKKIISQHIFMFPFRITPKTINGNSSPVIPACLESFSKNKKKKSSADVNMCEVIQSVEAGGWHYKPYTVDTAAHYSEYYYFYEYVQKAIFDQRDIDEIKDFFKQDKNPDVISYYFERPVANDSIMRIHIKRDDNGKQICFHYDLTIQHISLRLFSTDIGILTIELYNHEHPSFQDVLYINEYGRRIYPQFLPDDRDINIVKDSFLADEIVFKLGEIDSVEDFCPPKKYLEGKSERKLVVADYITKLLGDNFTTRYNFIPIIDDRMFNVCWYANAELIKELQREECFTGKYKYETSDEWYSLVFIDNSVKSVSAGGRMKQDLIKQFTYSRWIHKGTLFGITRYSLMCLTNSTFDFLRHHMERIYYQMAIILLAQRASILKFSDDVSEISGKIEGMKGKDKQKEVEKIADDVRKLHSSFIRFVNRLWFTEVTPQEQGIEMYNMAVKNMGLKEQLDELRHEIKELYEFVDMQYEKIKAEDDRRINKTLSRLNWLVVIFLPITIVSGLLGMNIYTTNEIPDIISVLNEFFNVDIHYQRLFILIAPTLLIYLLIFAWFLCQKIYIKIKERVTAVKLN